MNKTNYIILALILCFSIAFVSFPLKSFSSYLNGGGNGGDELAGSNDVSNIQDEDFGSEPDPDDVNIGDTFTGPSGATYELEEENLTSEEEEYYNDNGLSADGVWVETGEEESASPTHSDDDDDDDDVTSPPPANGGGCTEEEPPPVSPPPVSPPPVSPPPVSPPSNGGTPPSNGGYTPPVWTPPATSPPATSPPPTLPPTEPCIINYFELPERAWVGYPITGKWSAGAWCDDCDVDCTPYPECVWKQDSIGIGFDEYKFTLSQSGIYNYTLTCYGQGGIDERTETATVEALNLPWWREIIPVLQGFLRGIWG